MTCPTRKVVYFPVVVYRARLLPPTASSKPFHLSTVVRWSFGAITVGLSVYAIAHRWTAVSQGLRNIGWSRVVGSVPLLLLALSCGMLSWRAVLKNMGSGLPPLAAGRIYFVGQLGKYLPGSVWPILAQMELGRKYGIPRRRSASALLIAILIGLGTAIVVVSVGLPWMTEHHHAGLRWLLVGVPLAVAVVHPSVVWAALRRIPFLRFEDRLGSAMPARALPVPVCWACLSWVFYGLHLFLLAGAFHVSNGPRLFIVCLGGYALAWGAGMVAFMLPAGAGARDITLVFALSTQLPVVSAVAIAVVSRALATAADLGLAGLALKLGLGHPRAASSELHGDTLSETVLLR